MNPRGHPPYGVDLLTTTHRILRYGLPLTRHTISGAISDEPQHIIDHEVFGLYLEVVPEGTKPFTPGHFKPGTIAERAEAKKAKADAELAEAAAKTPEKKDNK